MPTFHHSLLLLVFDSIKWSNGLLIFAREQYIQYYLNIYIGSLEYYKSIKYYDLLIPTNQTYLKIPATCLWGNHWTLYCWLCL